LIDELTAADIVVIAAPMINFSVSSTLKAWFDYIARAGRPQGLMTGKRVIIVSASGGIYFGANAAFDFQVPWLRSMLGFLGLTDVEVIRVEGTANGDDWTAYDRPMLVCLLGSDRLVREYVGEATC
jgi:FMN-dependent NADH-azoreductase